MTTSVYIGKNFLVLQPAVRLICSPDSFSFYNQAPDTYSIWPVTDTANDSFTFVRQDLDNQPLTPLQSELPAPEVELPVPEVELSAPEGELSVPEVELSVPEVELSAPEGELPVPEADPARPRAADSSREPKGTVAHRRQQKRPASASPAPQAAPKQRGRPPVCAAPGPSHAGDRVRPGTH